LMQTIEILGHKEVSNRIFTAINKLSDSVK